MTMFPSGGIARSAQQAGQDPAKPAATVLFSGDFTTGKPGAEIAGAPGVRFGIEFKLEDTEPRVLTVRLTRPAPEGAPGEDVWLLAAGPGQPVQAAWEFAYGWEVAPGRWEMKVFADDVELASSRFQVVQAPEPVKAAPESATAPGPAKDKKNGGADKAAGKKGGKKDAAKQEPAKPDAARQDTPKTGPEKPAQAGSAPKQLSKADPAIPAAPLAVPAPERQAPKQPPNAEPAIPATQQAAPEPARPPLKDPSKAEPAQPASAQPRPEPERPAQKQPPKAPAPKPETAKPETSKQEPARQEAAKPDPARSGKATGLAADRRVYALIAGSFSEQARAMWMAVLVREQGVKACVRPWEKDGRRLWQLVAGWRNSPDEAQAAKAELAVKLGDIIIVPMSAGELEKGLQCH
ncbi:SPOR domain-containing protein [Fundidesulfovibrio agrisoli]|uniref:SPOR domain-containing protein n=1 Tax=Fundidesulfovibrio agrisoli TaxID=2922717 RepID=UPI001FACB9D9|nr:DUF3859 domain-containing protein [Fundidesulfovibrio agrisoli]